MSLVGGVVPMIHPPLFYAIICLAAYLWQSMVPRAFTAICLSNALADAVFRKIIVIAG